VAFRLERIMTATEPLIRNISDTALWAAVYRARESERPDALFRDPLARRLAGARGEQIAAASPFSERQAWSWVTRTYLFDQYIKQVIEQGVDAVLNLAAGLDARPYRLALPSSLEWIEVDLPDLLTYKEEILAGEKPACKLQRVRLDLANVQARRELFDDIGRRARRVLVITEGLLIYLRPEEVGALARDLAGVPSFQHWILDLASPGLLNMLKRKMGQQVAAAGAPFKFAPAEGTGFFAPFGWQASDVQSLLTTAARLRRVPLFLRLMTLWPESTGRQGSRPWGGVCLMKNTRC
jgi:methyltransferase (TIGR00027 family)